MSLRRMNEGYSSAHYVKEPEQIGIDTGDESQRAS